MGKSNLRFAGMSIAVNISIDGLGLLVPTTRQVQYDAKPPWAHLYKDHTDAFFQTAFN